MDALIDRVRNRLHGTIAHYEICALGVRTAKIIESPTVIGVIGISERCDVEERCAGALWLNEEPVVADGAKRDYLRRRENRRSVAPAARRVSEAGSGTPMASVRLLLERAMWSYVAPGLKPLRE